MKKILYTLPLIGLLLLTSCGGNNDKGVSILAPDGTPALGLANFYAENKDDYETFEIKAGADNLRAALTSGSHDIVVAPTNLGALLYNNNATDFVLYKTVVWGNLYLASTSTLESLNDLSGKTVHVFGGQAATPYIVLQTLVSKSNIENVTFDYTYQDVATATSALKAGTIEYTVTAQPIITKMSSLITDLKTIDLQEEWAKLYDNSYYPQASIFVNKNLRGKKDDVLEKMVNSYVSAVEDPATCATNAVGMYESFANLGATVLTNAIPHCHYGVDENQKEAIENYFTAMGELGLTAQYGGKLPDEGFYY